MRRLVLCCDGTWNTPDQESRDGQPTPTNVTRIAQAVADHDERGREQRVFYDRGVGTGGALDRITGGAFGLGVAKNVRDTYRYLVDTFEPGDEIFFIGFSRGAFTARSTAGFVRNCGILRRPYADRLDEAFALYRARDEARRPGGTEAALFRRSFSHETRIRFIGVFDTVGALGVPVTGARLTGLLNRRSRFHDTDLSSRVDGAFQALAMNERRRPFVPAIWTRPAGPDPGRAAQELEQVWFTGVHSDVGGGYEDADLADIALLWMVAQAERFGLALTPGALPRGVSGSPRDAFVHANALGTLHDSLGVLYRLLRPRDRSPSVADGQAIASSAVDRRDRGGTDTAPRFRHAVDGAFPVVGVEHVLDEPAPGPRR
jgi:uncharacterized protein (DUF2235 family)